MTTTQDDAERLEELQNKWRETGIEDRGMGRYTMHLPALTATEWTAIDAALSAHLATLRTAASAGQNEAVDVEAITQHLIEEATTDDAGNKVDTTYLGYFDNGFKSGVKYAVKKLAATNRLKTAEPVQTDDKARDFVSVPKNMVWEDFDDLKLLKAVYGSPRDISFEYHVYTSQFEAAPQPVPPIDAPAGGDWFNTAQAIVQRHKPKYPSGDDKERYEEAAWHYFNNASPHPVVVGAEVLAESIDRVRYSYLNSGSALTATRYDIERVIAAALAAMPQPAVAKKICNGCEIFGAPEDAGSETYRNVECDYCNPNGYQSLPAVDVSKFVEGLENLKGHGSPLASASESHGWEKALDAAIAKIKEIGGNS